MLPLAEGDLDMRETVACFVKNEPHFRRSDRMSAKGFECSSNFSRAPRTNREATEQKF